MSFSRSDALSNAIRNLPELLQLPVTNWCERLIAVRPAASDLVNSGPDDGDALLRLVARSEFAAAILLKDWDFFAAALADGGFSAVPDPTDLRRQLQLALATHGEDDVGAVKRTLRRFRDRQLLRVLFRESRFDPPLEESLSSLSDIADVLLETCVHHARRQLVPRFGDLPVARGQPTPLIVLAMGKLGGGELNFSSDVDLIFLYSHEGETDGERSISAREFFTRMARRTVALLDEVTADGFVYRVDTRLRPFGDSGPPVVSVAALEAYLVQHGRSWERYAYIKARVVGPAAETEVAHELMRDLIGPFVYRRYLDYGVFESLRDMKAMITAEVQRRELADNIKLGPGGIREIEFIVQSLQLVRGGADERLRNRNLLRTLPLLVHSRGLDRAAAEALSGSYRFMRRLENALQAIRDQQTHDLPDSAADRARVALALGYPHWPQLERDLERHRAQVSSHFSEVAFRTADETTQSRLNGALAALWKSSAARDDWRELLERFSYQEADQLAGEIARFADTRQLRQIDGTASKRLAIFIPGMLALLEERRHPSVAFRRVLKVVQGILRRSAYVALLNENPAVLSRLVGLCASSAYLAAEIARYPLLLDEMLDPRLFSADLTVDDMRADLAERLEQLDRQDSERAIEVLAQFQRATLFRIAVADIGGSLPIMKVSDKLTGLAEIVLRRALNIAWSDLAGKHGEPWIESTAGRRKAGFGVIAYGKLGGMELSYRSDLDIVFLHDAGAAGLKTDGDKPLDHSMFFGRLVRRLVHFLTTQTASGALYEVDTRLRPSGRSGLLVVSIEAFEKYQEENAWTWEHQALLRARPIAGSASVAREFERVRSETLKNRVRRQQLRDDVCKMRSKMRRQLDKSNERQFDLKQGQGGIGDIEFIVQYLVLEHASSHPAVFHYTDNIRQLGTLGAGGCLPVGDVQRLQQIYKAYRLSLHRLALDDKLPLVDAADFSEEREYVADTWRRIFGE